MTNTKWLRRALLGGVALSVMAAGAQADELGDLKAQLEALQSRVNTLESQPAATLPDGVSMLTFARGQGSLADWGNDGARDGAVPANRGFTISVTPTADMPAPVAEVVVYGYVKGEVIYDFTDYQGKTFCGGSCIDVGNEDENDHIRLSAEQSRFGIKSKVDTAIGQIRAKIEGDFYGSASNSNTSGARRNELFRLRHAYGEWDMTPNWTLLVGQTWTTAALLPIGISTVDFSGPAGPSYGRTPQVRIVYHDGPLSWAVAIERPSYDSDTNVPNVTSYFQYDFPGGHQFIVTGAIADYDVDGGDFGNLGWAVQAGANINLADVAFLTAGVIYGKGEPQNLYCVGGCGIPNTTGAGGSAVESVGFNVGLNFNINDTTSFNTAFGYFENLDDGKFGPFSTVQDNVMTVHANIMWRPVSQMQMGWEVMWGRQELVNGAHDDAIRAQFGAWFFF